MEGKAIEDGREPYWLMAPPAMLYQVAYWTACLATIHEACGPGMSMVKEYADKNQCGRRYHSSGQL